MKSEKYLELSRKSNKLFELTKKEMKKYKSERKKLLQFTESKNPSYEEWEDYIKYFEKLTQ